MYYFDNMSNTPPDPRVIEVMVPHLKETYGNPLNIHSFGKKTQAAIEESRSEVAKLIGAAKDSEIIFTSCGSESNNFAILGLARANSKKGKHVISSQIEHFSVLHSLKQLEKEGYKVTYLPVDKTGRIDPKAVFEAITPETILITLTHASNEIGTIEPIAEIAKGKSGVLLHVDAVQTAGNIPIDVKELGVDALTLSANQFYGPTGIAALYIKEGTRIIPFILGGMQEGGRRAGTHNISGIVGMGKAAELARLEMEPRGKKLVLLRDKLLNGLKDKVSEFVFTGDPKNRLPNHVSGCVKYVEGESISMFLDMEGIGISTGSACVSKALKASHVLTAIGVDPADVNGSVVFSLGHDHTESDIDHLLEKFPPIVERLRRMSPLCKKKDSI